MAEERDPNDELLFFDAIERGAFESVRLFLDGNLVDVNSRDAEGQTCLQVAVKEEHVEIIRFLLSKGARIGSALHDAINNDSIKCVKALVECDVEQRYDDDYTAVLPEQSDTEIHIPAIELLPPLVLAAQNDNYEISKYLMTHGYEIKNPHPKHCQCKNCDDLGRLGSYVSHLNTYRAFVSPVYISLEFLLQDLDNPTDRKDPVKRALVLKRDILRNAEVDYEFREEYLKMATKCEDFVVALLDQCRNLEEISILLSVPGMKTDTKSSLCGGASTKKNLEILDFAIKYKNNKVIAHRFSQVKLSSVFYSGLKNFEESNRMLSVPLVFLYWVFMPLCMLIYQVMPENRITKVLEIPIVKYLSHVGSWIWFVVLLVIAAFQDKIPKSEITNVSVVEIIIGIYIAGMTWEEIKQFCRQGRNRYLSQWWRVVAALVCMCFFFTGILWISDFAILAKSKDVGSLPNSTDVYINFYQNDLRQTLRLTANSFYALGVLLTFCQISHNFQVSYYFGPLHLSMMNMANDVVKFIIMFCLNYFAFAIGMRELYSWYVVTAKTEGLTAKPHVFTGLDGSFRHLFWALFGLTEIGIFETEDRFDRFNIIQITGELMFALYCVSAVLIALNLLIAMLTHTFHKVESDQDMKFKVARTRILMQYVNQGSTTPAPLNLIPGIKPLYSFIDKKCFGDDNHRNHRNLSGLATKNYNKGLRSQVVRTLLHRYFLQRKKQGIPASVMLENAQPQSTNQSYCHVTAL